MFLYIKTNILRGYGIFKNDFAHSHEPANSRGLLCDCTTSPITRFAALIQIHSSTNTLLHFTYRTPARVQVPVTSIFNLREASNEVKYFYSFIPDICFNLLWNSCNAEGDVGTVSSGGVTITVTTSFM